VLPHGDVLNPFSGGAITLVERKATDGFGGSMRLTQQPQGMFGEPQSSCLFSAGFFNIATKA
jgi:hypothetical protein